MIKLLAQDNLEGMIKNSRQRTLELIDGLDEGQLMGPKHPYVNPLLWEIGHIAFFYDYFILKKLFGRSSCLIKNAEKLYDSITIAHDDRWDLPLPSLKDTLKYMQNVQESVLDSESSVIGKPFEAQSIQFSDPFVRSFILFYLFVCFKFHQTTRR